MKNKKIIVIGIVVIVVILCIFGIFQIITSLKEKEQEEQRRQNMVKESINAYYDDFNQLATAFNDQKTELTNSLNDLFYQTIPEKNSEIISQLENYTEIIKKLKETSSKLEEVCPTEFTDSNLKRKCASYKISYDNAKDVYNKDIEAYNNLIEEYNEWIKTQEGFIEISKFVNNLEE